jgi:predicted dehydrogenase
VKPSLAGWCAAPDKADGLLHTSINGEVVRYETTSSAGNYMGYYDDVYKALTGTGPNPVPAADGIRNMRIIDAAIESVKEKRVVDL